MHGNKKLKCKSCLKVNKSVTMLGCLSSRNDSKQLNSLVQWSLLLLCGRTRLRMKTVGVWSACDYESEMLRV